MGTMIRLLGAVAENDSLEMFPVPYTGISGAKFVSETRISALLSRDISGNSVAVTLQGAPVFTSNYVRGGGVTGGFKAIRAAYAPIANSSRTMCVVARYVSTATGNAFAFSDHNGNTGCALFMSATAGWRGQILLTDGTTVTGAFPAIMPNLPTMDKTAWHFAVLTVDAVNRTASFKLPGLGYATDVTWTSEKTVAVGSGDLRISGASQASADSCDVAFATYHDRVLSSPEVYQQYYAAKAYCDAVGVAVV